MLISILIDVQYSQKAVFSFEKGLNRQNHSSSGSLYTVKKFFSKMSDSPPPPLGPSIFEEWNKNIFSFVEYILFTLDGGFYCWIVNEGLQNIWNIMIFKFIIPQINYSVLIKVLAEIYLRHEYQNMESQTRPNMEFTIWTSENKKSCYKTYMATYHIGDWIKAGVHLGKGSMGFGSLPFFKTDQIVPSIPSN